ncbi:septation protein A [Devosia sp.]|uniref:septation protein A n=1 Tax=Devosia sp. TaxID=1871048 RepID=UPI002EF7D3A4
MAIEQGNHGQAGWAELKQPLIKLALELGPLLVFFAANALGDDALAAWPALSAWFSEPIILATAVFMLAMAISLVLSRLILKRVAVMPLVTGVVVLVFGGLTLYLQDDTFIKMKPTIVNGLFGAVLLGGLLFGQSLLRYVFGDVYKLKPEGWLALTVRWGIFFFVLAGLNELIWRNFSTDLWVAFKVWGIMPLTLVFSMFQLPLLSRYAPEPASPAE